MDVQEKIIEAESAPPGEDDYTSSGYETSTQSLTSSINEYVFENGRRYHMYYGTDKSLLPIDETEKNRLDLTHEVYRLLLNDRLFKAPITDPIRVLDVGTGTGIWAIDMADRFPKAEVIGVDLTPIQPIYVPPNCRFEVDDVERPWTYPRDYFDFIHARNVSQGIGDWPKVLREMQMSMKNGGYIQLAEIGCQPRCDDGTMRPDSRYKRVCERIEETMMLMQRPFPVHGTLQKRLTDAGFEDVEERWYKLPLGTWPKNKRWKIIGTMGMMSAETGVEAYCLAAFTRVLGLSTEEATTLITEGVRELKDSQQHCWTTYYVAWGKKP